MQSGPFFSTVPQNQHVDVGGTIQLTCGANGLPTPKFLWFRNGESLDYLNQTNTGHVDLSRMAWTYPQMGGSRAVLTIKGVTEADQAMYGCRASNALDTVFAYAQVDILFPTYRLPNILTDAHFRCELYRLLPTLTKSHYNTKRVC